MKIRYVFGRLINRVRQVDIIENRNLIATYKSKNSIDVSEVAKGFYILKINNAVVLNFVVQ